MTFSGFPAAALDFYDDLELDNSKVFWEAHKHVYLDAVRGPMVALTELLASEFGAAILFRPYRDVRFAADKTPYKIHQGAVVKTSPSVGLYVQISAAGLMTGAGWYQPIPAQVTAFRAAVLDDDSGPELERIVAEVAARGLTIGGDQLKTAPRGVDAGHPRISLLRHRTVLTSREYGDPDWLATAAVTDRVRQDWRHTLPLVQWFGRHLGGTGTMGR